MTDVHRSLSDDDIAVIAHVLVAARMREQVVRCQEAQLHALAELAEWHDLPSVVLARLQHLEPTSDPSQVEYLDYLLAGTLAMTSVRPAADLRQSMRAHLEDPFPASVEKGATYGLVDPVMIGADIYGWALKAADGGKLTPLDQRRLRTARDELKESLTEFPPDGRPYFERLLEIASAVLTNS